jgi:hypothetical protein
MTARNIQRSWAAMMLLALLSLYGCTGSPEFVSKISVEDKIARLRIGESDKSAVEAIFGPEHGNDRSRWIYQFADKQFEIFERRQGVGLGALPISAGVVPTNTRAVITIGFSESGIVKAIEVARFFEEPFINDYWFLVKQSAKEPLESLAAISESVGFNVAGLDKGTGTFNLQDPLSKARVAVKLDGQILKITSRNPHHRQANEYRAYVKRETALTSGIANSDLVQ